MTTTQTQQPKALQLADRLKERIRQLNNSWNAKWNRSTEEFDLCAKSEDELRYQHAEIARLTAENRALRSAVSEAVAAEREACAELMEQQHTWITNVAASALIRARAGIETVKKCQK